MRGRHLPTSVANPVFMATASGDAAVAIVVWSRQVGDTTTRIGPVAICTACDFVSLTLNVCTMTIEHRRLSRRPLDLFGMRAFR